MAVQQRELSERSAAGECRGCRTFCDHMIEPRSCLEMRCGYLYSWVEEHSGSRYMGCMRKVFKGEINVDLFETMEKLGGYGGIKMTGRPLSRCQYKVEPAHTGAGPEHECVNPAFFDCTEADGFDLRDLAA